MVESRVHLMLPRMFLARIEAVPITRQGSGECGERAKSSHMEDYQGFEQALSVIMIAKEPSTASGGNYILHSRDRPCRTHQVHQSSTAQGAYRYGERPLAKS